LQADGFRALEEEAKVEFQIELKDGKSRAAIVTGPDGEKLKRGF
jgi:cold shock CspA family protein